MTKHDKLVDVSHTTAQCLQVAGTMDVMTMREFDALYIHQCRTIALTKSNMCDYALKLVRPSLLPTSTPALQQYKSTSKVKNILMGYR